MAEEQRTMRLVPPARPVEAADTGDTAAPSESPEPSPERALLDAGYRYALSLRASPADAEDLVQEAWFRLLRRYGVVRDRPLLFRTIRNLFIDEYRRSRVLLVEALDDTRAEHLAVEPEMVDASLIGRDLSEPLGRLRPAEREVLYLAAVEEYTASEIAELTGRPRGTVLSLGFRAKRKLRKILAEWPGMAERSKSKAQRV